jgi:predicted RNase H-like nuclease
MSKYRPSLTGQRSIGDPGTWIYGVDGTRNGWVVARATPNLWNIGIYLVPELEPLFWRVVRDDGILAIDIPIGLPQSTPRSCDREARRLLGQPRGSSVFPAPMRTTLNADDYREACQLNQEACGKKISRQTFNLLPKLREVDALMWVERQQRIFESHPELGFMLMSGRDRGLASGKKRPAGRQERLSIVQSLIPDTDLNSVLATLPDRIAPLDDKLDALACLITARRIANGTALRLPSGAVEFDARNLRMEIFV